MKYGKYIGLLFIILFLPFKSSAYDYVNPENASDIVQGRQSIHQLYSLYESLFPTPEDEDEQYNEENVCDASSYMWPIGSDKVTKKMATGKPASVTITSKFGSKEAGIHDNGHGGMDIGASLKTNVIAAQSGEVVTANKGCKSFGPKNCGGGYGNYIIIKHDDGNYTLYAHLHQGTLKVKKGTKVNQGQVIAGVGSSGDSTGAHLHFEVREGANNGKSRVDPLKFVDPKKPRPSDGDSCDMPIEFLNFIYGLEHGGVLDMNAKGTYTAKSENDGADWTIGPGLTNYTADGFKKVGIDPKSIHDGTKISKKKVNKVYVYKIKQFKKDTEKALKDAGISLNNNQILALTSLKYNSGNIKKFVSAYKSYGNSPKAFNGFCHVLHSDRTFWGGLIKRRKLEWIMYSTGVIINNYSNNKTSNHPQDTQSSDNSNSCIGNFKVPSKEKSKVNKFLEKTASEFNGKITYY